MKIKSKNIISYILAICVFVVILLSGGCGAVKDDNSSSSRNEGNVLGSMDIVTTMYASYDFANAIAGDRADVTMLLKPGEESHSYDPSPQDIIKIRESDLFIYNGGENEEWVEDILSSTDGIHAIKMMDCVGRLYEEDAADDEIKEYDEHVWASPVNAAVIVRAITDELISMDKDGEEYYNNNCEMYTVRLDELDRQIREITADSSKNELIFGDRFPVRYFVEEYGLRYYAAFPGCSAEAEPSAATVTFLIDKVREDGIPVIFVTELSNDNVARLIASETGADIRTFYACHNVSKADYEAGVTYLDMMEHNKEVLKEALN